MSSYIKLVTCKCFKCHSESMEKFTIDYDKIKSDMQIKYNEGFNDGYKKAKEEIKVKLGL